MEALDSSPAVTKPEEAAAAEVEPAVEEPEVAAAAEAEAAVMPVEEQTEAERAFGRQQVSVISPKHPPTIPLTVFPYHFPLPFSHTIFPYHFSFISFLVSPLQCYNECWY